MEDPGRHPSASVDFHLPPDQNNPNAIWQCFSLWWCFLAPTLAEWEPKPYCLVTSPLSIHSLASRTQVLGPLNSVILADSALSLTSSQGRVYDDLCTDNLFSVP